MRTGLVGFVVGALLFGLVPALARTVPSPGSVPRVAVVARGDNPVDALAAGPVAAAVGGIVVLSQPSVLSPQARAALEDFAPDLVVLAGGEGALSSAVASAVAAAGDWEVRRVAGDSRYDTAAALAALLGELGLDGLSAADGVPADPATTYVPALGTPAENGQALRDAARSIPAGPEGQPQPWTLRLGAGTYDLGSTSLVLRDLVTLLGDGASRTIVTAAMPSPAVAFDLVQGSARVEGVTIANVPATPPSPPAGVIGVRVAGSGGLAVVDATVMAANADGDAIAVELATRGGVTIAGSSLDATADGFGNAFGVLALVTAFDLADTVVTASGPDGSAAVHVTDQMGASGEVVRSRLAGTGGAVALVNTMTGGGELRVRFSQLAGGVVLDGPTSIAHSQLDGPVTGGVAASCFGTFDAAMAAVACGGA